MERLTRRLRSIVGDESCLARDEELFVYQCDGLTLEGTRPLAVVLPERTSQVQAIVRACLEAGVPLIGPECAIPLQTRIENLREIPETVRRWHDAQNRVH